MEITATGGWVSSTGQSVYRSGPAATGPASYDMDAFSIVQGYLDSYGLGSLATWAMDFVNRSETFSSEAFLYEMRQQPAYQRRFAGNQGLIAAGLQPLSEDQYLAQERQYAAILRSSGLPSGFYDQTSDFTSYISGNVSPAELQARITDGYNAVKMANPEVTNQMRQLYGVTDGQLAAYFLDPNKALPLIQRQAQSAQIAAQGRLMADMQISRQQAEELATYGVTQTQAMEGFGTIAQSQGLFQANLAERESIGQAEQIGAVFGTNAAAQQRIRKRQRTRQAEFEQGGGFAVGAEGQTAIG